MNIKPGDRERMREAMDLILECLALAFPEIEAPEVFMTREMDEAHRKSRRSFAKTLLDIPEIHVASAIFDLDDAHFYGILAHEMGHVMLRLHTHTEVEADRVVLAAGLTINYDTDQWPGKGLQYLEVIP